MKKKTKAHTGKLKIVSVATGELIPFLKKAGATKAVMMTAKEVIPFLEKNGPKCITCDTPVVELPFCIGCGTKAAQFSAQLFFALYGESIEQLARECTTGRHEQDALKFDHIKEQQDKPFCGYCGVRFINPPTIQ